MEGFTSSTGVGIVRRGLILETFQSIEDVWSDHRSAFLELRDESP